MRLVLSNCRGSEDSCVIGRGTQPAGAITHEYWYRFAIGTRLLTDQWVPGLSGAKSLVQVPKTAHHGVISTKPVNAFAHASVARLNCICTVSRDSYTCEGGCLPSSLCFLNEFLNSYSTARIMAMYGLLPYSTSTGTTAKIVCIMDTNKLNKVDLCYSGG